MKRGRKPLRSKIIPLIIEALENTEVPLNINSIKSYVNSKIGRNLSWNTVMKYVQELIELGKIEAIALPHSKDPKKFGLTLYRLKRK